MLWLSDNTAANLSYINVTATAK